MYSNYYYSPFAYNPFGPLPSASGAYPFVINAGTVAGCYNPSIPGGAQPIAPCPTDEEILNYVMSLETNRKLDDLANVQLGRTPGPGDCLAFDPLTGLWTLTNFISGGEF